MAGGWRRRMVVVTRVCGGGRVSAVDWGNGAEAEVWYGAAVPAAQAAGAATALAVAARGWKAPLEAERRERRGVGAPVVERLRRRRQNMFPSDAHPGRVTVGRGSERGGWNGAGKSSAPAAKEEVVVARWSG
uniref:Uncharacterized protein n=1 Tax=Oryza sativa subsp. japonica TaxID=39947 RepID=Q2QQE8_ORYSJ|nr:hypothetical protein LOC_Os12g31290 [Oryza sativa Japonica Group]